MWTVCTFKKENSTEETQGWIESKKAKKGLFVQLVEFGKEFWEITFTGSTSKVDPSMANRTWCNDI